MSGKNILSCEGSDCNLGIVTAGVAELILHDTICIRVRSGFNEQSRLPLCLLLCGRWEGEI